jgi:hypothetical protein
VKFEKEKEMRTHGKDGGSLTEEDVRSAEYESVPVRMSLCLGLIRAPLFWAVSHRFPLSVLYWGCRLYLVGRKLDFEQ